MNLTLWKGYHGGDLSARVCQAWDTNQLLILCPPLLRDLRFLEALPEGELEFAGTWSDSEMESARSIARSKSPSPFSPVLGVFTSGTLSTSPRLVLYTKENLSASIESIFGLFDKKRIEHVFCYPQAFHTFGLTLGYLASHLNSWQLHTPHGKYQRSSHDERIALREERILTLGTPTHFYDLLQVTKEKGKAIAPSYSCIMGGAGVSFGLWHAVRDELKIEAPSIGYGCTEASPGISHLAPGVEPIRDDEIGKPLSSLKAEPCADGVKISGPALCAGIIQNGQLEVPKELVIRDRISVRGDGSWVYGGRLDLTLNRGGQKFSLEAIEKILHEKLNAGVVASAVRDTRFGEDLGLAFIPADGRSDEKILLQAQEVLLAALGLRLNPNNVIFLNEFPLNECSKLDRRAVHKALHDEVFV